MILLGSTARTRTLQSGTFWCPREGGHRRYRLCAVRRWARIGRVPLVPLAPLGQFVECGSCDATFGVDVLGPSDPAAVEDILTAALRRAAGRILAAGGPLCREQQREAVILLQRYTSGPYTSSDLVGDIAAADGEPLGRALSPLAIRLNDHGREVVIDVASQLATGAGPGHEARIGAFREVATVLSASCDRLRATIDQRLDAVTLAS